MVVWWSCGGHAIKLLTSEDGALQVRLVSATRLLCGAAKNASFYQLAEIARRQGLGTLLGWERSRAEGIDGMDQRERSTLRPRAPGAENLGLTLNPAEKDRELEWAGTDRLLVLMHTKHGLAGNLELHDDDNDDDD